MMWMDVMVQSAGRATFVLLAAFAASWLLKTAPAAWRHFLWTALLAGLLMLPVMVRVTPKWGLEETRAIAVPVPGNAVAAPSVAVSGAVSKPAWNPLLPGWLAGCVLAAGWFLAGRLRIWRMVRRASEAAYARAPMDAAGGREVRVLESASAPTALAMGIWRPVVVLPRGAGEWPVERLRAALLHELMHVRRRDLAAQAIAQAACCLYWFHPLAWMAARQLRRERERACDDAVLGRGMAAHDYAEHLVELVRVLRGRQSGAMTMAEPSELEGRVRALLDGGRDRRPLSRLVALAMVAALGVVLLPLAVVTVHAQPAPLWLMAEPISAAPGDSAAEAAPPAREEGRPAPLRLTAEPISAAPARAEARPAPPDDPAPQQAAAPARGTLTGSVEDPSGARVPGCEVRAANLDSSHIEITRADLAGQFRFDAIPAGRYSVEVRSPGFAVLSMPARVEANQPAVLAARLTVGQLSETVTITGARPSPAAAPAAATPPQRIRVGGNVQAAKLLRRVAPVYPEDLKAKGITGTVSLRGVVTKAGDLTDLAVVNTDVDPGLATAAMEAARHWLYQPSLLNGQPVAVLTTIDVRFELEQ